MLPEKIRNMLQRIFETSQNNGLQWSYDDENDIVSPQLRNNKVGIHYGYDSDRGISYYRIDVTDSHGREASYPVLEDESGYDLARKVYAEGTADSLEINLDDL